MTTFQAFLVLITLIQCGGDRFGPQRIYPNEDDFSARLDEAKGEKKSEVKGQSKRLKSQDLESDEHPSADDEEGVKPSTQAER